MEPEHKGKRIPFFFIPIPRFVFEQDIFQDHDYFRFLCFAFHRTAYESKAIFHCGQRIDLEPFEFIFGRSFWAQALGMKERKVRSYICQLSGHNLAVRLASKSASKYTVYKWVWDHFPGNSCQRHSQQEAGKAPATRPQIKNKNKEKEQQQLSAAAAFLGKAQKLFQELPEGEREAVMALFYKRSKKQPVENVEAWFVKCIEESWHREEKLKMPESIESDFDKNKALAEELQNGGLPVRLRTDFLEVDLDGQLWQIFFSEPQQDFLKKLEYIKNKLETNIF